MIHMLDADGRSVGTMSKDHQRFVALAAVAWADGRMTKNEATGLMHAAQNLGLDEIGIAVVQRVTQQETSLDEFDPEDSEWEEDDAEPDEDDEFWEDDDVPWDDWREEPEEPGPPRPSE